MKYLFVVILLSFSIGSPAFSDPAATLIINEIRKEKRRKAIRYSPQLEAVATAHANDMASQGYFSHTGANGSSIGDRTTAQGYKWCFVAENIARGQQSLEEVMAGWKASKGHYKNMTHKKAGEFGLARGPDNYWVMVLAAPC
ncbi:CAP domain-containing protein [Ascidiaceihabitans sp.]|nr:CAP domain-containing protein [Ascidiaceihabitans sp.]